MLFMIRLSSDITTKASRTRRRFTRMVMDNLADALHSTGVGGQVLPGYARLFVESTDQRATRVISHVFGVHSVSPVDEIEAPTLVVVGEHDTSWLPGADLFEAHLPRVRRVTLADSEHHPHPE